MREFEGKKLLLLGGIKTACDIVTKAQEMGVYVTVADYNTDSPAKMIADESVLLNATDVDAIVEYCKSHSIDGITTGFVDILMEPCYEACKRLELPCYFTPKMLKMATDKIDFKETCVKYGVPVPKTYLVGNIITSEVYEQINYPVFVKPLDASGSRGAGVCRNREELERQFADALNYSASGNAIIEDYITGTEFLLDYVGVDGEFRLLSMFDRYMSPDRGTAINYSNVSLCPAKCIDQYYCEVNDKVIAMFKDLGFNDGLIFLQGYTDGEKITFYEMGSRLGGSFYTLEDKILGLDPVEMTIRCALTGKMLQSIDAVSIRSADFKRTGIVCNYLLKDGEGTIASIEGIAEIKQMSEFVSASQRLYEGDVFKKDRTVDKPVVCFYMVADDSEHTRWTIAKMNELIRVSDIKGKSLLSEKFDPSDL